MTFFCHNDRVQSENTTSVVVSWLIWLQASFKGLFCLYSLLRLNHLVSYFKMLQERQKGDTW